MVSPARALGGALGSIKKSSHFALLAELIGGRSKGILPSKCTKNSSQPQSCGEIFPMTVNSSFFPDFRVRLTLPVINALALLMLVMPVVLLAAEPTKQPAKPNVLIILVDDMGYSDLGCYGSEIKTPNIDRLAANGMKFTQMYNTAKCFPSRASLLTGVYFQNTDKDFKNTATLGEVLRPAGYTTLWSGKQHAQFNPVTRGFDRYFGMIGGAENHFKPNQDKPKGWALDGEKAATKDSGFYSTDAYTDKALKWLDEYEKVDKPFLLYVAYTAPHWPLQAWPEDIAKYKGAYDAGYEAVRNARYERQIQLGLVDPKTTRLSAFEQEKKAAKNWNELSPDEQKKQAALMEIYAAMVDRIDQDVGRLVQRLKEQGKLVNTLIMFMADNGGCAENPKKEDADPNASMGSAESFLSYGSGWATVSDTPLRKWKQDSFEGGISTPLVVHWPVGIKPQTGWNREPTHLVDIMPTVLSVTGATYPGESKQTKVSPINGVSLVPAFKGEGIGRTNPLFFQFGKGSAIRDGQWKLVRNSPIWELYDMAADRSETTELAAQHPEVVQKLSAQWLAWWKDSTGSDWTGKPGKADKDKKTDKPEKGKRKKADPSDELEE